MKIGRYGIIFGRTFWVQCKYPVRTWHFWFIWVFREARITDIDKNPQFPLGTSMKENGNVWHYYKKIAPPPSKPPDDDKDTAIEPRDK